MGIDRAQYILSLLENKHHVSTADECKWYLKIKTIFFFASENAFTTAESCHWVHYLCRIIIKNLEEGI